MELNQDHGIIAAIVAVLAWLGSSFAHAFHFGGRLAKIEAGLEGLDKKFDRLEERINKHLDRE